jgi:hypothetical protein
MGTIPRSGKALTAIETSIRRTKEARNIRDCALENAQQATLEADKAERDLNKAVQNIAAKTADADQLLHESKVQAEAQVAHAEVNAQQIMADATKAIDEARQVVDDKGKLYASTAQAFDSGVTKVDQAKAVIGDAHKALVEALGRWKNAIDNRKKVYKEVAKQHSNAGAALDVYQKGRVQDLHAPDSISAQLQEILGAYTKVQDEINDAWKERDGSEDRCNKSMNDLLKGASKALAGWQDRVTGATKKVGEWNTSLNPKDRAEGVRMARKL